jgi:polar amino acid transport system substrate-binding protein
MTRSRPRRAARSTARWTVPVAACAALLLSACGSASDAGADAASRAASGGRATASAAARPALDRALADALPPDVRASGRLRIVTDASYAPASEFGPDGRTIIGFEPDLGAALGAVLGVQVTFTPAPFDDLTGLVSSGQADLVMSAMTDTKERERTLDFVNYFSAGSSIVVQRGNPTGVTELSDLCGSRVAVQRATVQVELLRHAQANCPPGQPIDVRTYATNDDALVQLRTGRATAVLNDYPPAVSLTTDPTTGSRFQLASTVQYEPGWYGIGVAKSRPELRNAVQGALQSLVDSGHYGQVLRTWNVADGAVPKATINAGAGES